MYNVFLWQWEARLWFIHSTFSWFDLCIHTVSELLTHTLREKNIGQREWNVCRESVALGCLLFLLSPAWLQPTCSESYQFVTVCPPSWVFPRPWEVVLWISLWFMVPRVLTNSETHSSTTAVSYVTFLAILIHFLSVFYLFQNLIEVGSYSMWLSVSSFCPLPEHP